MDNQIVFWSRVQRAAAIATCLVSTGAILVIVTSIVRYGPMVAWGTGFTLTCVLTIQFWLGRLHGYAASEQASLSAVTDLARAAVQENWSQAERQIRMDMDAERESIVALIEEVKEVNDCLARAIDDAGFYVAYDRARPYLTRKWPIVPWRPQA